ncbi:hypothetical protein J5N97_003991 [Dioscorea zingiberensis]|uniref:Uncharacterized protein n=1 Tax=Dioscorea zingiberensis TaxID=325984 RepID=A0A9D5HQJ1_9LILI|nr:hypothetical protein J5N97_003991 [Dioscorea zingiberensis]
MSPFIKKIELTLFFSPAYLSSSPCPPLSLSTSCRELLQRRPDRRRRTRTNSLAKIHSHRRSAVHLVSRASSETTGSEKENENKPPRHYQLSPVYNFVKLPELYYAGSYGMDIKGPAKGPRYTKAKIL